MYNTCTLAAHKNVEQYVVNYRMCLFILKIDTHSLPDCSERKSNTDKMVEEDKMEEEEEKKRKD